MKKTVFLFLILQTFTVFCQDFSISGTITDDKGEAFSFVTILLNEITTSGLSDTTIKGATSDDAGQFLLTGIESGKYQLSVSFLGYETMSQTIEVSKDIEIGTFVLIEKNEALDEVVVSAQRPIITKEPGRLTFTVENTSLATGNTLALLAKTPGVLIVQDRISIKNLPTTIYINNKRVYLSASEVTSLLTNMDASFIKSIEVISNPSASYDAEGGAVLNIETSKAISIGYKGSAGISYEQAIFPKYNLNTSHFYKNDWLNFYASYGFSPRKEVKDQEDHITFFEPNGQPSSLWESDFKRTTRSWAHQGNLVADFTLNDKNELSISSQISVSPNRAYENEVFTRIFNPQRQLDSTFATRSSLNNDKANLSFNAQHVLTLGKNGTTLTTAANYVSYNEEQIQDVNTQYFLPSGDFLRNNSFFTQSDQDTKIYTGQSDLSFSLGSVAMKSGVKYSRIETDSKLDFFDTDTGSVVFNNDLSDNFIYKESIYAAYIEFAKKWTNWNLKAGLRGEYTDVSGDSRSLGEVNTQEYFEVFPTASIERTLSNKDKIGLSYARRINRPRYQSLNPFRYFLNENNFTGGNPNLGPAFDSKITLSYNLKNKWFFELYYQETKNPLGTLSFQDNTEFTVRSIDANLIRNFQYSLDVSHGGSLVSWWYVSAYTSAFYLENEFFSVESLEETYSNHVFGLFVQLYNGLTLSEKAGITSDVTARYLSNFIYGSYDQENQFSLSFSIRKSLWNKRAVLSIGVNDIFDTNNIPLVSRYYNQDNSYFSMAESRLFRASFTYNFGNARLRNNKRNVRTDESDRL